MQTEQGNMLLSLQAVERFLNEHAASLGSVIATGARQKLVDAIADLSRHASNQTGSAMKVQLATNDTRALRAALVRDHMSKIAGIAKAELPNTPDITPLRMLRGRPSIPKLVAHASGMADAAATYKQVFIDNGLPADFIERLNAASDALTAAVGDRRTHRGNRLLATTSLKSRLSAGRRVVHILDTYVKSALKDDKDLLKTWNSVKRVERTTGRPAAAAEPAPTTAAA